MSQEDGRCPFCGAPLNPSSSICPSCSRNIFQARIENPGGDKMQPQPPSIMLTPKNLIIAGIVVLFILALPIIVSLNLNRNKSDQPSTTLIVKTVIVHDQLTQIPTTPAILATVPSISPTPTQNSTPSQIPGSTLCQANWTGGMNGWAGSSEWKVVNGKLLSDGTNTGPGVSVAPSGSDSVTAPCQLSTTNYAVEAKIQIVDTPDNCYFAIRGRVQADNSAYDGYFVGYDSYFGDAVIIPFSPSIGFTPAKNTIYSPGLSEHTYRAEFRDNQITLKIDGSSVLQTIDNKFITSGQVGLENGGCQISVSSFRVVAL